MLEFTQIALQSPWANYIRVPNSEVSARWQTQWGTTEISSVHIGAKCGKIKHLQHKMTTGMCRKPIFAHNPVHSLLNSAFNFRGCLSERRLSRELKQCQSNCYMQSRDLRHVHTWSKFTLHYVGLDFDMTVLNTVIIVLSYLVFTRGWSK